jgi:hypothetical protein
MVIASTPGVALAGIRRGATSRKLALTPLISPRVMAVPSRSATMLLEQDLIGHMLQPRTSRRFRQDHLIAQLNLQRMQLSQAADGAAKAIHRLAEGALR